MCKWRLEMVTVAQNIVICLFRNQDLQFWWCSNCWRVSKNAQSLQTTQTDITMDWHTAVELNAARPWLVKIKTYVHLLEKGYSSNDSAAATCTQCTYWDHFNEQTSGESVHPDPNLAPCWSNLSTFGCCSCAGHAIKYIWWQQIGAYELTRWTEQGLLHMDGGTLGKLLVVEDETSSKISSFLFFQRLQSCSDQDK